MSIPRVTTSVLAGSEINSMTLVSDEGWPVFIRIQDDYLIIEQLTNCLLDEENTVYVGGELETLLVLHIK